MNTTTIFAEILIIGIQGSAWIILILLSIFGVDHVPAIGSSLKEWAALTTIICIAAFFSLGVILDRVFDVTEKAIHPTRPILAISAVNKKAREVLDDNRVRIHFLDGTLTAYQQYIQSRLRVARATFFNLMFIAIGAFVLTFTRFSWLESSLRWKIIWSILGFSVPLILLSLIAYATLQRTFEIRNEQVQAMLLDMKTDTMTSQPKKPLGQIPDEHASLQRRRKTKG